MIKITELSATRHICVEDHPLPDVDDGVGLALLVEGHCPYCPAVHLLHTGRKCACPCCGTGWEMGRYKDGGGWWKGDPGLRTITVE